MMKPGEFFSLHPIFTIGEVRQACFRGKADQTARARLYRAQRAGQVRRLKQGLYQSRPAGMEGFPPPSPLLVASRLAFDAILSHHSAFEALGAAHSVFMRLATYWTRSSRHCVAIENVRYQPLLHPSALRRTRREEWGIETVTIQGLDVRTTGRERTFVDGLQDLRWVGGWEEFCHCVDKFAYLNLTQVLEYASHINSPALNSRLGLFLEHNQERFYVGAEVLEELRKNRSSVPVPLIGGDKTGGKRESSWNVTIPPNLTVALGELT
ncbi:MAG: hypothetical protein HY538_09010 [Deltaproteobacteria bacterium]|nr:hypothetical protein [Deltaproteobacteria bacterium]